MDSQSLFVWFDDDQQSDVKSMNCKTNDWHWDDMDFDIIVQKHQQTHHNQVNKK